MKRTEWLKEIQHVLNQAQTTADFIREMGVQLNEKDEEIAELKRKVMQLTRTRKETANGL